MADTFLAIDAGLRGAGAAIFDTGAKTLLRASYVANPRKVETGITAWAALAEEIRLWAGLRMPVVVETMRHRPGKEKGDPQNILEVQGVAACAAMACCSFNVQGASEVVGYEPHQWKGTVDGDVMTARILDRLTDAEKLAVLEARKTVLHNVVDAIGLGLYFVGRLHKPRVISRGVVGS